MVSRSVKVSLAVFSCLAAMLLSGMIYGWAPIQLFLIQEHQYEELCDQHEKAPCPAQLRKLSNIYTVGSFVIILMALPGGFFLDQVGPQATVALSAILNVIGLVLFGASDSKTFDYFAFSYAVMAAAGALAMFAGFPVSFVLPEYQTLILSGVSCCFDASCIIFQIFYTLNQWTGVSRKGLFWGYSVVAILVMGPIFYFWSLIKAEERRQAEMEGGKDIYVSMSDESTHIASSELEPSDMPLAMPGASEVIATGQGRTAGEDTAPEKDEEDLTHLKLSRQMQSLAFATNLGFTIVGILRATLYIGINGILLGLYGDADTGYAYNNTFGVILPLGVLLAPMISRTVDAVGMLNTMQATNLFSVANFALAMIPNLQVQVVNFIIFAMFRAYLYSCIAAFNAKTFGVETMGRFMGMCNSIGAFGILLQPFIIDAIFGVFHGRPTVMCIIFILIGLALTAAIELYRRHIRRSYGAMLGDTLTSVSSVGLRESVASRESRRSSKGIVFSGRFPSSFRTQSFDDTFGPPPTVRTRAD
ncbi:unnamed protein product [Vitrella brassicaformis CCMP3155]|uniref:Major facilitator superfamily (MFS) profile domain-containing protein n=2 Tax=Vitrella brassicaformis TaxID=1169539 RepID=A0A0G4ETC3_VITBC|nr:unnamed protein product [Vitrella brassicaformis CCMP3155]|eukprot:CEM01492.1 unnamed protein product [Vitrella brassicaformis CCMP3155]